MEELQPHYQPATADDARPAVVQILVPTGDPLEAVIAAFPEAGLGRDRVLAVALDPDDDEMTTGDSDDWRPWAWRWWLELDSPSVKLGETGQQVACGLVCTNGRDFVVVATEVADADIDDLVELATEELHQANADYWRKR